MMHTHTHTYSKPRAPDPQAARALQELAAAKTEEIKAGIKQIETKKEEKARPASVEQVAHERNRFSLPSIFFSSNLGGCPVCLVGLPFPFLCVARHHAFGLPLHKGHTAPTVERTLV